MNFEVDESIIQYVPQFSSDDDYDSTESFDFNSPPTPIREKVSKLKNALTLTINRLMFCPHKPVVEAFSIADSIIGLQDRILLYSSIDTQDIYIPNGLYELFKVSNYQIGINSTAIVEGMTFNLKTFILKDSWYLEMIDFIKDGYVKLIESDDEVISGINKNNFKLIDAHELYLDNSFENLEKELQS